MKDINKLLGMDVKVWTYYTEIEGTLRKDVLGYIIDTKKSKVRFKGNDIEIISPHKNHPIIQLKRENS